MQTSIVAPPLADEMKRMGERIAELEAENAALSAHQCTHGESSEHGSWLCPLTLIEQAAKGRYWQMAKGKVRSGEPLYGAAIIEPKTNKIIMLGEGDDLTSAIRALEPAQEK
jgi:hypothetical protein